MFNLKLQKRIFRILCESVPLRQFSICFKTFRVALRAEVMPKLLNELEGSRFNLLIESKIWWWVIDDWRCVGLLVLMVSRVSGYIISGTNKWIWKNYSQIRCYDCQKPGSCSLEGLKLFLTNSQDFPRCFVIVDGTSIFYHTPDTKEQFKQRLACSRVSTEKTKTVSSTEKVMAIFFWDCLGITLVDYF